MAVSARQILPESSLLELEALLQRQNAVESLPDFISRMFPTQPAPAHAAPILDVFEQARRKPQRVCISMPPRHTKTTIILRGFAWWLHNTPADTCAYVSYSDRQARSKSRLARSWAGQAGLRLAPDSHNMAEWRTLQGGGLLSCGAGGGITGQGVSGIFVVDDPYKNRQEADSIVIRERIEQWFNEVVFTRLEGASVIVVHTRWHENDLIGTLAEQGWRIINLPAIAEDDDPLGRVPGEALWPAKFDLDTLHSIRKQINDWSFAALYQGRPRPRGASVFGQASYYDPEKFDARGCRIVIGCDPAATAKTQADHSVAVVLAMRGHGDKAIGYVLDMWRGQVEIPALVGHLRSLSDRWWHAPVVVEAMGGFKAVPQILRQLDSRLQVREAKVTESKFLRAQAVAAAWNGGRLLVPTKAPWLKTMLSELQRFTGVSDAEDDIVDALAHAYNALSTSSMSVAAPDVSLTQSSWAK
ncbi:MAG: terminase family protein [Pseudomonadota bacterium]